MYFAQNLKHLRKQKGVNQDELAEVLGVKRPTIGNWETGSREPNINMLVRIAGYFNVTLDELVIKNMGPLLPEYAGNLCFLRKQHGMEQTDLADLLGVKVSTVSKYESGKVPASVDKLLILSDYFGVTLDQLVKQDLSKEVKA